ncbi:hypothetical protein TSAR_016305 [Trichomalopsis sarcophagae]|uniref:Uncharacterized protein n=1 Tax=Trichomalopsis sarcophagae TaxID=543379 RepID=A0A232ESB9_9HYME|nr:hypothetical protein TSAR_016305 [Trichomalopsis sarcophagae]
MADEGVTEILRELGFEAVTIESNKISMAVLPKMNEEMINSLLPAIGDRAVFLDYWKKNFKEKDTDNNSKEAAKTEGS